MEHPRQHPNRPPRSRRGLLAPLALATILAAAGASAQTTQNNNTRTTPPPKRPVTTTATPAQQQAAASRWHLPFFGNKNQATNQPHPTAGGVNGNAAGTTSANQHRSIFENLFHRNTNSTTPAPVSGATGAARTPSNQAVPAAQRRSLGGDGRTPTNTQARGFPNGVSPGSARGVGAATHLASTGPGPLPSGRPVQSQAFLGHPAPAGSYETRATNGNIVRTAADGSVMDVRNPATGMSVHHGLDGSRRITVDKPDGSRVFVPSRGVAYVQHPYLYQAHPFDHRTFSDRGQLSHQLYRPYTYGATTLDAYAPQRFYSPEVYQWATTRYNAPQVPSWNYVTQGAPWFVESRSYFTPEATYTSPLSWLTDFVLASSLIAAYNAHLGSAAPPGVAQPGATPPGAPAPAQASAGAPAAQPPAPAGPPLTSQPAVAQRAVAGAPAAGSSPEVTPEVKEMLADEVRRQLKEESIEARQNAQNKDPQPGQGGIVQELNQKEQHTFVVVSDLDLVDSTGRRCTLSEADLIQVISGPKQTTGTAEAIVLSSRGSGTKCERSAQVDIALADLQEMQNYIRETMDAGVANTRTGRSASTATPAYAASAPPPDPNAANEIQQQQQIAALAAG
ncbi:MAG TPA: hypothetical protein VEC10_02205 [Steroidobacteraceae bacterium]|nr:hypothetical protein [Steroidobacteraceae bacterium]